MGNILLNGEEYSEVMGKIMLNGVVYAGGVGGSSWESVEDLVFPMPVTDANVIYSSEYQYSTSAYLAFTPLLTNPNYWLSSGATNQYVGYKFSEPKVVNYYEVWARNQGSAYDVSQAPKEWILQGSNDDGETWVDIDTEDFTFTSSGEGWKKKIDNTEAYKWYRIYITTAQSAANDCAIGYIKFMNIGG